MDWEGQDLPSKELSGTVRAWQGTVMTGYLPIATLMVVVSLPVSSCAEAALRPMSVCATCASALQTIYGMAGSMASVPAAERRSEAAFMTAFILLLFGIPPSMCSIFLCRSALLIANKPRECWTPALLRQFKRTLVCQAGVFNWTLLLDGAALGCAPFLVFPKNAAIITCAAYCALYTILSVAYHRYQRNSLGELMVRLLPGALAMPASEVFASKQAVWTRLWLHMQAQRFLYDDVEALLPSSARMPFAAAQPAAVSFVWQHLFWCGGSTPAL